ncbi:hypothetical protein HNV10_03935 [Winogradskyella litoriviva]|uniref:Uncharacterized protein n=1 Tax=Winogradskyella litoriviva TaxID=1220182 RepID=A0ABX2E1S3_9FLAO|nr:hypothetical protein [Winogradskyella litoriviva]NRD22377.1 hypothetical protein [Winogradskyella litoriviva]
MQRTEIINKEKLFELIEFILSDSKTELYESYSEMENELVRISNFSEFKDYFEHSTTEKKRQLGFGIYNPESKGKFTITKLKLDPKYCNGKTYRNRIDGWGIIYVHLNLLNTENEIECRISVNSRKRAENWKSTNPEFGNPELWDWKIIESNARKIIKQLKKYTQHSI